MDDTAIRDLAARLQQPMDVTLDAERRVIVAPPGWDVHDLATYLPPPPRIQQRVELLTLDSFTSYLDTFALEDSAIFADESAAEYRAVLDYHGESGRRAHCDHVVTYSCPPSDQWRAWKWMNGKPMGQIDFARFLEDNLPDVAQPPAAEFLKIILAFHAHKSASFVSETRLENGETKLRYEETIRNESRQGDIAFPDGFQLQIPIFVDGPRFPVSCRLRFRITEGKLSLWYEIVRPMEVFRAAVKEVSDHIRKTLPDFWFWSGKRV